MTLDLHKLANTPGYGISEKTLRKAGKWRLTAVDMLNQIPQDECSDHANEIIDEVIDAMEAEQ